MSDFNREYCLLVQDHGNARCRIDAHHDRDAFRYIIRHPENPYLADGFTLKLTELGLHLAAIKCREKATFTDKTDLSRRIVAR